MIKYSPTNIRINPRLTIQERNIKEKNIKKKDKELSILEI